MKVKAVIFDLGGTLVDFPPFSDLVWGRFVLAYRLLGQPDLGGIEIDDLMSVLVQEEEQAWRQLGRTGASDNLLAVIARSFEKLGVNVDGNLPRALEEAFYECVWDAPRADAEARAVLRKISDLGMKLGLISNTLWRAEPHIRQLERDGLMRFFDHWIFSSSMPRAKLDPSIFKSMLRQLEISGSESIFVGDRRIDDIQGATNVGMFAVLKISSQSDGEGPDPDLEISALTDLLGMLD